MLYKAELDDLLERLVSRRKDLEEELSGLPKSELICYVSHGINCFSERIPKRGNIKKEKRKGIKKNPDFLYRLARKTYVTKALVNLDKDIDLIMKILSGYKPFDENSVMAELMEKYPEITPGVYRGVDNLGEWSDAPRTESDFHTEDLKSISADGSKRRSLGEIVIGSRLSHYSIPYVYEAPFSHPDLKGRFSPDFTIKRPRDGKIIYWEHIGKVNDQAYMEYTKYKLSEYEKYGIVPWDNLIISYSTASGGINEKLIDGLISGWLL